MTFKEAAMVSAASLPSRKSFRWSNIGVAVVQLVVVRPVIVEVCTRLAVPAAAVVTVFAVLKAGSSVAVAAMSVQMVERENLAFPVVAVVVQRIVASRPPVVVQSAGRKSVSWALKPPDVSA
jgi:hypothetical protein